MSTLRFRLELLTGLGCLLFVGFALVPPISQDPLYHRFADARTIWGVPNYWNVISNIGFIAASGWGWWHLGRRRDSVLNWERLAWGLLICGVAAVGIGSAYYHLQPDNARLCWDRLPMAIVFMCVVAGSVGEQVSSRAGKLLLLPLVVLGVISVVHWRISGDLRLYALVQFGSLIVVSVLFVCLPSRSSTDKHVCWMVAFYVIAKLAELFDHEVARVLPTGGHPWKHGIAAVAVLIYLRGLSVRSSMAAIVQPPLHK